MTKLSWGNVGERYYEAGVDRGVLFVDSEIGIAWNGLVSVNESPDGGEAKPYYVDGFKYLNLASAEEYTATITAYSCPPEFDACDGTVSLSNGLFVTNQPRKSFGLCYRTKIGNDTDGPSHGYKIHLIYNALAAPSDRDRTSVSDSIEPIEFSWAITTMAPLSIGYKPTAHFVIDSSRTLVDTLNAIEDILYGTDAVESRFPSVEELIAIFAPAPEVPV